MDSVLSYTIHGLEWRNNAGQLHRLHGPALILRDGTKEWYTNGKLHRIDGPAIEHANGAKLWYLNGMRHRIDGPAFVDFNMYREFWYRDVRIPEVTWYSDEFQCKIIMEG